MRLASSRTCGWTVSTASPQQQEQRPDVCLHPCMLASQAGFSPALRLALNGVRRRGEPLVPSVVFEQWAALMRGANIRYGGAFEGLPHPEGRGRRILLPSLSG
jgi:hypothetical protein